MEIFRTQSAGLGNGISDALKNERHLSRQYLGGFFMLAW
jgi:hypothetical protein